MAFNETIRGDDGKLPAFAWPGGYPIIYVCNDGGVFCPACANGENGSLARTQNGPDDVSDDGWLLEGFNVHYEGPDEVCDHCGTHVESAYGDPDAQEG